MAYVGYDRVPGVCYIMHAEQIKNTVLASPFSCSPARPNAWEGIGPPINQSLNTSLTLLSNESVPLGPNMNMHTFCEVHTRCTRETERRINPDRIQGTHQPLVRFHIWAKCVPRRMFAVGEWERKRRREEFQRLRAWEELHGTT